jgi:DNA (cytosine-5)-methyltransferase 1
MRYLSLFSGIEAATQAWKPLGWEAVAFSEIEPFPCAVLDYHYPNVPNLGDITEITEGQIKKLGQIDLVVFGSPCQDLSVAGKRKGLEGERSGLFTTAIKIIKWARKHNGARFALWENVPGAFSSNSGKDFGEVIKLLSGAAVECEKWQTSGVAIGKEGLTEWRVLDAKHFGVPQRRRRVFALADFGDWAGRQPILFEREGVCRDIEKGKKEGKGFANVTGILFEPRSPDGTARIHKDICPTLNTMGGGQREPCVVFRESSLEGESSPTLTTADRHAVAYDMKQHHNPQITEDIGLTTENCSKIRGDSPLVRNENMQVRRLTPKECERLQGFPDDFTRIPYKGKDAEGCPDTPRYKAIGNSMAVPVMRWIGERIESE